MSCEMMWLTNVFFKAIFKIKVQAAILAVENWLLHWRCIAGSLSVVSQREKCYTWMMIVQPLALPN